jgi:hypothetical protein
MSFRKAARLAVKAGQCSERTAIAVEETKELMQIDVDLQMALRENDAETWKVQKDLLLREIKTLEQKAERHWYEHPFLWTAVGALITTGIFYGAVKTVNHAAR